MSKMINDGKYKLFFTQVKEQVKTSQTKAALSVNTSLIRLYWQLGQLIVEKQKENAWGNGVIEQLAKDLKAEFPAISGFSRSNLFAIKQFYTFYASPKVQQLVGLLPDSLHDNTNHPSIQHLILLIPWGHHVLILARVKDPKAAFKGY